MPYPFVLPTTSSFSFSSNYSSPSHPSLPLNASTYRGVVRDALKKHKRLPPASQTPNLSTVVSAVNAYIPYLLAIDNSLNDRQSSSHHHHFPHHDAVTITLKAPPTIEWRPTLSAPAVPGKELARVKIHGLEYDVSFSLSALGSAYTLLARFALQPLYLTTSAPTGSQERTTAISSATKHLLDAASVYDYLATRAEVWAVSSPPCADISAATVRGQSCLALAEATLLAVLKDDPYPAVVAQDRNKMDKEWMFKAPEIPKVRAHLFARLCLAASEHAAKAYSLCAQAGGKGEGKLNEGFIRYLEDLRRTSRAKACRFFGIDAELGGQTGDAIGWLHAALQELGVEVKDAKKSSGLSRLKKEWTEKREDRKVEKGTTWGADAGKMEEIRVIEMLETKWSKQNDTVRTTSDSGIGVRWSLTLQLQMFTQAISATGPLLAQMPSGREIHSLKPYDPPVLDSQTLEAMRAPPDRNDDFGDAYGSSDDETAVDRSTPVGAFPGTKSDYGSGSSYY